MVFRLETASPPFRQENARNENFEKMGSDEIMKMLRVKEVSEKLKVSKGKAYEIIRDLNKELKEKGYITIQGRIREDYLIHRLGSE